VIGVERVRPAHVPQALPMTVLDGPVDPLPERVSELDGRRLEDPRGLDLPGDGVRGPRRPPGPRRIIVLARHLSSQPKDTRDREDAARRPYAATAGRPAGAEATRSLPHGRA